MSYKRHSAPPIEGENQPKRSAADSAESYVGPEQHHRFPRPQSQNDRLAFGPTNPNLTEASSDLSHHFCHYTPKCFLTVHQGGQCGSSVRSTPSRYAEEGWHEGTTKTIRAENEVEAHREANNYRFGFRKWKGSVTEKPISDRSDIVRQLYCDLSVLRPHAGSALTFGNVVYLLLFGWLVSLTYLLVCPVMFLTVCGAPYGRLCWKMVCYFIWPFGKSIEKVGVRRNGSKAPTCEVIHEEDLAEGSRGSASDSAPILVSSPATAEVPGPQTPARNHWFRPSTYLWLLLGFPVLAVVHSIVCLFSWLPVFSIPVAKMNARVLCTVLLMPPEDIQIHKVEKMYGCQTKVILCCYRAFNVYYYKYCVQGINIFALNLLPLVFVTLVIGYMDPQHNFFSSEVKFATAISSIIPLSYYIGMGIASISAQSNFAVGAVVNATFGSITEMTFYITALLRGHRLGTKCYEEVVKAALTGTLLGCILFIPGICMVIGGIKHREQRFNSRSAGVSSALLFISIGGVFSPTLFSKIFGTMTCEGCTNTPGNNSSPFICRNCHYDTLEHDSSWVVAHVEPLVYTVSLLLPAAYLIGLIFTLKTHVHIYDIHVGDEHGSLARGQYAGEGTSTHNAAPQVTCASTCINSSLNASTNNVAGHPLVHWSRWRAMAVLVVATVLMAACADLSTENIGPMLSHASTSQYFIGVTVLAMVPELPEIVNGIQFALQNNISLSLEVGSCIAVQVCMIQIPLLILFNAFYDVGFVLVFSDIHLWSSIFSVILVNYIFMDGKCDYFQGTALVVVYFIILALYFFAPSPRGC